MRKLAVTVIVLGVGIAIVALVANAFRMDRQGEALSLCGDDVVDSRCGEASLSDDGKCVVKTLPDGAECKDFKESFCQSSCVCKGGESQFKTFDCDDGNPCTNDWCGCKHPDEDCREDDQMCISASSGIETCGPNENGQCLRGLCVMPNGIIYLDHPRRLPRSSERF